MIDNTENFIDDETHLKQNLSGAKSSGSDEESRRMIDESIVNENKFRKQSSQFSTSSLSKKKGKGSFKDSHSFSGSLKDSGWSDTQKITSQHSKSLENSKIRKEKQTSVAIGMKKRTLGNNAIRTHKYTMITFAPLNLFEQLTKPTNMYFLFIAMLECIPDVSTTMRRPMILITLTVFIVISAIKDLMEDLKRFKADRDENRRKTEVLFKGKPKRVLWRNLHPGEIVILKNGESVPADCLLIYSSDPNMRECYIDTSNIDGETMLKRKLVATDGSTFDNPTDCIEYFRGKEIVFERENPDLETFSGTISGPNGMIQLSIHNVLLRGSAVQNTDYVYAIVLYTG